MVLRLWFCPHSYLILSGCPALLSYPVAPHSYLTRLPRTLILSGCTALLSYPVAPHSYLILSYLVAFPIRFLYCCMAPLQFENIYALKSLALIILSYLVAFPIRFLYCCIAPLQFENIYALKSLALIILSYQGKTVQFCITGQVETKALKHLRF